jgi:hypothetical protein
MARRLLPLDGASEVQVEGQAGLRRYPKDVRTGTITVTERDARSLLREGLAVPAGAAGPTAHLRGFVCPTCARRNYFKTCGHCGDREGVTQ